MGDVIAYQGRNRPLRINLGEGGGAQILFFTGVRYQRMSEAAPTQPSGGQPSSEGGLGGKRKRKRG
jgi:hypothetical protein